MNRREAISAVAILLGGTVIGSNAFLTGCKNADKQLSAEAFSAEQVALLDEIGDTILPTTNTPGAKAAKVGEFMKTMVTDCYEQENQKIFQDGIQKLETASKKKYDKSFMDADATQRHNLLVELDKEQKDYMANKKDSEPSHYFRMIKELTMLGYFTSEIGATQALRYVDIPGRYDGCIPYKKGDKAWA